MPVVGLTYRYEKKALPYRQALAMAGLGCVDITPSQPLATLDELDGFLLSGGTDIGEDPDRDELEMLLIEDALRRDAPLLGICRGLQVLNVCLRGTLHEDIPNHKNVRHGVSITPGSMLARIVGGESCSVNSRHHQAIDRLGEGLAITARARDGIIEAVEDPSRRFLVAVQWHPEDLIEELPHRAIFEAFAQALH